MAFHKSTTKSFDFDGDTYNKSPAPSKSASSTTSSSGGSQFLREMLRVGKAGIVLAALSIRPVVAGTPSTTPPDSPTVTTFLTTTSRPQAGTQSQNSTTTTAPPTTSQTGYLGGMYVVQKGDNDWMTKCWNDQGFQVDCATWTGYHYTWNSQGLPITATAGTSSATRSSSSNVKSLRRSLLMIMTAVVVLGCLPAVRAAAANHSTNAITATTTEPFVTLASVSLLSSMAIAWYPDPLAANTGTRTTTTLPQATRPCYVLASMINDDVYTCNPATSRGIVSQPDNEPTTAPGLCVPGQDLELDPVLPTVISTKKPLVQSVDGAQHATLDSPDYVPQAHPGCQLLHPDGQIGRWDCVPTKFCAWKNFTVTQSNGSILSACAPGANPRFQATDLQDVPILWGVGRLLKMSTILWMGGLLRVVLLPGAGATLLGNSTVACVSAIGTLGKSLGLKTAGTFATTLLSNLHLHALRSWWVTRASILSRGNSNGLGEGNIKALASKGVDMLYAEAPSRHIAVRPSASNNFSVSGLLLKVGSAAMTPKLTPNFIIPVGALRETYCSVVAALSGAMTLNERRMQSQTDFLAILILTMLLRNGGVTATLTEDVRSAILCDEHGDCTIRSLVTIAASPNALLQIFAWALVLALTSAVGVFTARRNRAESYLVNIPLNNSTSDHPYFTLPESYRHRDEVPDRSLHTSPLVKLLLSLSLLALFFQYLPLGAAVTSTVFDANTTEILRNVTSSHYYALNSNGTDCRGLQGKKGGFKVPKGGGVGASGADTPRVSAFMKPILTTVAILLAFQQIAGVQAASPPSSHVTEPASDAMADTGSVTPPPAPPYSKYENSTQPPNYLEAVAVNNTLETEATLPLFQQPHPSSSASPQHTNNPTSTLPLPPLRPLSLSISALLIALILMFYRLPTATAQSLTNPTPIPPPQITSCAAIHRREPAPMQTQLFYNTYTVIAPYHSAAARLSPSRIFHLLPVLMTLRLGSLLFAVVSLLGLAFCTISLFTTITTQIARSTAASSSSSLVNNTAVSNSSCLIGKLWCTGHGHCSIKSRPASDAKKWGGAGAVGVDHEALIPKSHAERQEVDENGQSIWWNSVVLSVSMLRVLGALVRERWLRRRGEWERGA